MSKEVLTWFDMHVKVMSKYVKSDFDTVWRACQSDVKLCQCVSNHVKRDFDRSTFDIEGGTISEHRAMSKACQSV